MNGLFQRIFAKPRTAKKTIEEIEPIMEPEREIIRTYIGPGLCYSEVLDVGEKACSKAPLKNGTVGNFRYLPDEFRVVIVVDGKEIDLHPLVKWCHQKDCDCDMAPKCHEPATNEEAQGEYGLTFREMIENGFDAWAAEKFIVHDNGVEIQGGFYHYHPEGDVGLVHAYCDLRLHPMAEWYHSPGCTCEYSPRCQEE